MAPEFRFANEEGGKSFFEWLGTQRNVRHYKGREGLQIWSVDNEPIVCETDDYVFIEDEEDVMGGYFANIPTKVFTTRDIANKITNSGIELIEIRPDQQV